MQPLAGNLARSPAIALGIGPCLLKCGVLRALENFRARIAFDQYPIPLTVDHAYSP